VANEFSSNRLAPLWIVLGLVGVANVAMLIGSGSTGLSALGGSARYSLSTDAVKFEWWRLFSGAVGHYSLISFAINMFGAWWIGRYLAPRLRMLRFVTLAVASLFCGALVTLLIAPHDFSYAGLSLSAGLVGAQIAGQKRGTLGRLVIPQLQRFGYASWFIGWLVLSSLFSGLSSIGALGGGFACGFGLGWLMFERSSALLPNLPDPNERRHGAIALGAAAVAVLAAVSLSQTSGSVAVAQARNKAVQIQEELIDDLVGDLVAGGNPITQPNSFRISMMEDKNDIGDMQAYMLNCGPEPTAKGVGFVTDEEVAPFAVGACQWINSNADTILTTPETGCLTGLVWETSVQGVLADGREIDATFEVSDEFKTESFIQNACGTQLSLDARKALWGFGRAP
jgi:membrane associated rhomboid family serine protease